MSKLNLIEQRIKELDGGAFQNLFDCYLCNKYKYSNICTVGKHDGTNKVTKGIPDSYVENNDGTYILIMYGTTSNSFKKLKEDIEDCINESKTKISNSKIKKIICGYASTNITIEQNEELKKLVPNIELELICLSTISMDLCFNYPDIVYDHLGISIDTRQIYSPSGFIQAYDKSSMTAPLNIDFFYRESELKEIKNSIIENICTVVIGQAGVGKTKIVLESLKDTKFRDYTILCVRNNGEILSSDISTYISKQGKYILFLDDANNTKDLNFILDYIYNPPKDIEIKLIMTIRDYAKGNIIKEICKHSIPNTIKIETFNKDEIEEIIQNNVGIKNKEYLEKIAELSKGNIRLAVIAGYIIKQGHYKDLKNTNDIYKYYYMDIIDSQGIDKNDICTLFIISLMEPLILKEDKLLPSMLNYFQINYNDFIKISELYAEKEIVDKNHDFILKISDQCFKDFIIYYVLIEKKYISIIDLLNITFPIIKNKVVQAINSIIEIFYSEDAIEYITQQILESWKDVTDENIKLEYLKCFYRLNEDKALLQIKKKIELISKENYTLYPSDFEKNYANTYNDSIEINVLSGFKYSNYSKDAIQLLLKYADKNKSNALDVYNVFCHNFLFDEDSHRVDYQKEYELIDEIWKYSDSGNNYNITFILLNVLNSMISIERQTYKNDSLRTITIKTFRLILTEGCKRIREYLWSILAKLYSNENYQCIIEEILFEYRLNARKNIERDKFIKYDINCFENYFRELFSNPNFSQAVILENLEAEIKWQEIQPIKFLTSYKKNKQFYIVSKLIPRHERNTDWHIEEENFKKQIIEIIKEYTLDNFKNLFHSSKKYENLKFKSKKDIVQGLKLVFITSMNDRNLFKNIFEIYVKEKCPYAFSILGKVIPFLLEYVNANDIKLMLNNLDENLKNYAECLIYSFSKEESITEECCIDLINFIKYQLQKEICYIPNVYSLAKYKNIQNTFYKIVELLINDKREDKEYLCEFIGHYIDQDNINKLFDLFKDRIELLEKLYLLQLENNADYENLLFDKLFNDNNINFWDKYTKRIKELDNIENIHGLRKIFNNIWHRTDYDIYINKAIENIYGDEFYISSIEKASFIFGNSQESDDTISRNKQNWIKQILKNSSLNKRKISNIFDIIVHYFEKEKIQYFQELINLITDIDVFKSVPLFTYNYSWSGSELPIIDKRINFLYELLNILVGSNFIEHRCYIKQYIENLKEERKETEIREYIQNIDIL